MNNFNLDELLQWCNEFITRSADWRRSSFEIDWRMYQRNADSIFDPQLLARKEPWQSKAFLPLTPSHRETIQAQLFKTMCGPRPMLEINPRFTIQGELDQSEDIRDFIVREMEKSKFEVNYNAMLDDVTTYGSGFARIRFETVTQERMTQQPVLEPISPTDPTSIMRAMTGQRRQIGYQPVPQEVLVYRGVRFEHLNIWDIFPDPKAINIKGNPIAYRYQLTTGQVKEGVDKGYYLPEAFLSLQNEQSIESTPTDKKLIESDRKIQDSSINPTKYGNKHWCYELYAKLPKKWVYINGEPIDDPEKLVSARVQFHKSVVLSVVPSDTYDGEPPIYKCDYLPVAGRFYGRGICEQLKDLQAIYNEEINQRLDCKALTINPMFTVIAKAIVNPEELVSKTGGIIKLDAKTFGGQPFSVDSVLKRLEMGSVDPKAYVETQELERMAQERTSANRITLGTADETRDANETLGGMELLRNQAGEKFAYIGLLQEFSFMYDVFRAYWMRIYENLTPEDVTNAIGPQRAQFFQPLTPEQIEQQYIYSPQGVYTMENKAQRAQRLAMIRQQFLGAPYINDLAFFKKELQTADEDPETFLIPEAEAMQIMAKAQQMAQGMAQQALQGVQHGQPGNQPQQAPIGHPGAPQSGSNVTTHIGTGHHG